MVPVQLLDRIQVVVIHGSEVLAAAEEEAGLLVLAGLQAGIQVVAFLLVVHLVQVPNSSFPAAVAVVRVSRLMVEQALVVHYLNRRQAIEGVVAAVDVVWTAERAGHKVPVVATATCVLRPFSRFDFLSDLQYSCLCSR